MQDKDKITKKRDRSVEDDGMFVRFEHKDEDEKTFDGEASDKLSETGGKSLGEEQTVKELSQDTEKSLGKKKIFKKYQVKDIVFLAIMSAIVLVTSAVMPLVVPLQSTIFGIAQLVTGLQLSVFPAIALMKVRKVGSMFFMAIFTGIIQLLMSPAMFANNIVIGLILELAVIVIFKGYDKEIAVFFAVALYNPLSLPFNYVYNLIIGNEVMTAVADKAPWAAAGMSMAVLAVSVIGTLIGIRISKELSKAGVLKK